MKAVLRSVRNKFRAARMAGRIVAGYLRFRRTGKTPGDAYQSLIHLFCQTGGRSNDRIHSLIALGNPPYPLGHPQGILGLNTPDSYARVDRDLREKGYHVFETRLSAEVCDRLMEYSLRQEAKVRPTKFGLPNKGPIVTTRFDRNHPLGVRYDYDESDNLAEPEIQRLISDPSLLAVSQNYLRCKPVLDIVTMWWHTAFADQPDEEAAQFYHFDMDRVKWLKFFFYVTDVTPESGPHCFIARSHRTGGIPQELLKKGYQRLTDEEVESVFPDKRDWIEFSAPRGTIIAEDTRGLHKGKHVQKGDRLVFQLQFCDSLFGSEFGKGKLPAKILPELAEALKKYPRVFSKFSRSA